MSDGPKWYAIDSGDAVHVLPYEGESEKGLYEGAHLPRECWCRPQYEPATPRRRALIIHNPLRAIQEREKKRKEKSMPNNPEFQVHMLNDAGKVRARRIAAAFDRLLDELTAPDDSGEPLVPAGRELAIVKTNLETACFYAKKAAAKNPANQDEALTRG